MSVSELRQELQGKDGIEGDTGQKDKARADIDNGVMCLIPAYNFLESRKVALTPGVTGIHRKGLLSPLNCISPM